MLVPHIFGGSPVISRIIAMSSFASLRCCSFATFAMNADGLTLVFFVLFAAIVKSPEQKKRRGHDNRGGSCGHACRPKGLRYVRTTVQERYRSKRPVLG